MILKIFFIDEAALLIGTDVILKYDERHYLNQRWFDYRRIYVSLVLVALSDSNYKTIYIWCHIAMRETNLHKRWHVIDRMCINKFTTSYRMSLWLQRQPKYPWYSRLFKKMYCHDLYLYKRAPTSPYQTPRSIDPILSGDQTVWRDLNGCPSTLWQQPHPI